MKKWRVFVRCSTRRYALPAGPFRGSEERVERRLFIFETANRAVVKTYLGGRAGEDTLPTGSENLPTLAELPGTLSEKIFRNI